ncbi:MAG: DUF192 domain-containing protein [Acidithiobacillus sp.]
MSDTGMIFREGDILWAEISRAHQFTERLQGLLGIDALTEAQGLLLTPCGSVHTIGMRFPIDVIFLDSSMRVRACHQEVQRWRWRGCWTAHSTLEVSAGGVRRHAIKPGQYLQWRARQ